MRIEWSSVQILRYGSEFQHIHSSESSSLPNNYCFALIDSEVQRDNRKSAYNERHNQLKRAEEILNIEKVLEKQQMVLAEDQNIDVFGISGDQIEASVQIFYIRKGRVVGRKGLVVDRIDGAENSELAKHLIVDHYSTDPPRGVPGQIIIQAEPNDRTLLETWLSSEKTSSVRIKVPLRGEKKSLLETVINNAAEEFLRHRLKREKE